MNWFIWALLSAFFAAVTALLAKLGVAHVSSNLATAIRTSVILVFTWGLVLATGATPELATLAPRTWLLLTASGVATGLSWLCYFRALQLGDVAQVAPVDKLSVALAVTFGVCFLGEKIGVQEAAGIALIVAGAVVMVVKF